MARATLGRFVMLPWRNSMATNSQDNDNIREVKLLSPSFQPQDAIHLLAPKSVMSE